MNANTPRTNSDIDMTIDRALSTLRDAQPRSGLNGRILANIEQRATNPGGPSFRVAKGWGIAGGSPRGNPRRTTALALWAATSAAILAIASLAILHHSAPPKNAVILSEAHAPQNSVILSERSESKNPDTARLTTNSETPSTTSHTTHTPSSRPEPLSEPQASRTGRSGETPVFENARITDPPNAADPDAQALADLHAPSHPAPPLPLTSQEKLFRRMALYRNATQLAELDPIVRAKESTDETTAFKAFFPDPPPLKQTGDNE